MLVFLHITATGKHAALTGITYLPTWDRHPDYTVLPIGDALQDHHAPVGVLTNSYNRTTATVGRIPGVLGPIPRRLPGRCALTIPQPGATTAPDPSPGDPTDTAGGQDARLRPCIRRLRGRRG